MTIFVARVTHTPSPAHCAQKRHLQTPTTADELKTNDQTLKYWDSKYARREDTISSWLTITFHQSSTFDYLSFPPLITYLGSSTCKKTHKKTTLHFFFCWSKHFSDYSLLEVTYRNQICRVRQVKSFQLLFTFSLCFFPIKSGGVFTHVNTNCVTHVFMCSPTTKQKSLIMLKNQNKIRDSYNVWLI